MVNLRAVKLLGRLTFMVPTLNVWFFSNLFRHLRLCFGVLWEVHRLGTNTDDVTQHNQTHIATISLALSVPMVLSQVEIRTPEVS